MPTPTPAFHPAFPPPLGRRPMAAAAVSPPPLSEIARYLSILPTLSVSELAEEYLRLHDEPCRSRNRDWLQKKVARRVQTLVEGGLTERAKQRIDEVLAWCEAERRHPIGAHRAGDGAAVPPAKPVARPGVERGTRSAESVLPSSRDPRLPPPGTALRRVYKGVEQEVIVEHEGCTWKGRPYGSLSEVAKAITGTDWNGFRFFALRAASGAASTAAPARAGRGAR